MKLNFISAHQRVGPLRKTFGIKGGGSRSYPLAGKLTTHTEEIDLFKDGLKTYHALLAKHAAKGHALMKGNLKKELVGESRTGMADNEAKTNLLVLDIDGVQVHGFKKGKATQNDVKRAAEAVLDMLPEALQDISYIAVGSSSFGRYNDTLSVHLHFLLEKGIEHRLMKEWLRSLNYTQQRIYEKLELTPAKLAVKSIIDPCLAEASRMIYIAPPNFGPEAKNPFADDKNRIVLVTKKTELLDIVPILEGVHAQSNLVAQRKKEKLHELQRAAGISTQKRKMVRMRVDSGDLTIVKNPEQTTMTLAYFNDRFVAYNVGAGDSNAYIVQRNNPEIVTCFKPDEPPFLFKEADPQAYAEHVKKFGEKYSIIKDNKTGKQIKVKRMMFTDRNSDLCNTLAYNADTNEIIELVAQSPTTAADYMRHHGQIVPDPIPPFYLVCDPTKEEVFYSEGESNVINRFKASKYLITATESPFPEARYGVAWQISVDCPIIAEIILHMLGDDMECFERFINWFAYIFQTKQKTKTAWLLQGTEGTGKGLFYHHIVRPIFGADYSKQALLQMIAEDQFNGWMQNCLFLMVDEFDMKATGSIKRTASMLKNAITEPTMMIRHMQQVAKDVDQRMNFIMGTNELDALAIHDKRRFNIAPQQKRMLRYRKLTSQLLDFKKEYDGVIEKELDIFCAFLRDFKVQESLVSAVYESEARAEALRLGLNAADKFFHNLATGNFDAFVEILDKKDNSVPERDVPQLRRVKEFLRSNLEHVNKPKACYVHKDDLRSLYSYLAGKPIADNAFGRMLAQHSFVEKRTTKPVGAITSLITRPRCIKVQWEYSDTEALQLLRANNIPLANVTPLQHPPQVTDEELKAKMAEARQILDNANKESW